MARHESNGPHAPLLGCDPATPRTFLSRHSGKEAGDPVASCKGNTFDPGWAKVALSRSHYQDPHSVAIAGRLIESLIGIECQLRCDQISERPMITWDPYWESAANAHRAAPD